MVWKTYRSVSAGCCVDRGAEQEHVGLRYLRGHGEGAEFDQAAGEGWHLDGGYDVGVYCGFSRRRSERASSVCGVGLDV